MIRCHCQAPAIYQGRCLFHQKADGIRPDIDSYTGQIRETPAEKKAREKAAARAMRAEPKAPKVIRPTTPRREVPTPDAGLVLDAYNKGQSILAISQAHGYSRRAVTKIVHDAGLITSGPTVPLDLDAIKADYLAGMPRKEIARKHRTSGDRLLVLLAGIERPSIVGARALPVDTARLLELYGKGMNGRAVARELGISEKRVHNVLAQHGVLRPRLFGECAWDPNKQMKDTA